MLRALRYTMHVTDPTLLNLPDESLAARVQAGETELFGLILERYETKLSRYGRKFLSDPEDMKDLVQDIFLRSYERIQSFDPSLSFSSWVYRIAHNTFANYLRKKSRTPLVFVDFDTFLAHPVYEDPHEREQELAELEQMMQEALGKLSSKYREVLVLYYSEELSYKEIADVLEIPPGTVGVRVKRAREALQRAYKELHHD